MGIFYLPPTTEKQMEICQKLTMITQLSFQEKDECKRLAKELGYHKQLSTSEKSFLENLIRKNGSRL